MGLLRVLLALSVLLAHVGGIGGYAMTGGPMAVQAFFIISGFYMALVLNERYDRPELNRTFYVNRALRIYSLYAVFLLLSLGVYLWVQQIDGQSPLWPYFDDTVSWPEKLGMGLLNLTLVGQDITQFIEIGDGHFAWSDDPFDQQGREAYRFMLVPVAWSLSLEICFYALAPFVVRRPAWQIATLMAASLALRIAAAWGGVLEDPFSYRFFPFELAMFLAGALAYKAWAACPERWERWPERLLAPAVLVALLAHPWLLGSWSDNLFFTPARIGTLALLVVALPAVHGLTRNSRLDRAIGELSYPVYLSHGLVYGVLPKAGPLGASPLAHSLTVIFVTLALSWLVVRFLEAPIAAYRRRLARRAEAGSAKGGDRLPGFA